jgi:hypothetical protein
MGNQVNFVRTTFIDHNGTSYGFRVYDDYDCTYHNAFPAELPEDPQELLTVIIEHADLIVQGIVDSLFENMKGASIDGQWFDWEVLEPMLRKAQEAVEGVDKA